MRAISGGVTATIRARPVSESDGEPQCHCGRPASVVEDDGWCRFFLCAEHRTSVRAPAQWSEGPAPEFVQAEPDDTDDTMCGFCVGEECRRCGWPPLDRECDHDVIERHAAEPCNDPERWARNTMSPGAGETGTEQ